MTDRKNKLKCRFMTLTAMLAVAMMAWADGDQREGEQGTKWVDPVEYFELQDISGNDLQRDYDQGDIDISKVIKQKGKKVYGLRLKPIAGAARVRKYLNIGYDDFVSGNIDYQDSYGIEGVPLNESAFCIYVDEGVSRNYSFSYGYQITETYDGETYTDRGRSEVRISITGLHLDVSGGGVGLNYALSAKVSEKEQSSEGSGKGSNTLTKSAGVDPRLGKFIYFNGGRYLLVMLGASAQAEAARASSEDLTADEKEKMSNHAWPRVYFIVEEIMVEDDGEAVVPLTATDKQELKDYVDDLRSWLRGDGDPLGLGERTDEKTAVVINVISTVGAILVGGTLAGFVGGTGAQIAANMTETIINAGSGGDFPPMDSPEGSEMDGVEPKRKEEEEETSEKPEESGDGNPPAEDDPSIFKSEQYAHLIKDYVKQDIFGDITVLDPVTGEEVIYTNNGDDTWRNLNTGQDWTPDEIGRRLEYKKENRGELLKTALKAEHDKMVQRAKWDWQNKRDKNRGYSDEMIQYRKEKAKNDEELRISLRMSELAKKYDMVSLGDGSNVMKVLAERKSAIMEEQKRESKIAADNIKLDQTLEVFQHICQAVDGACDTIVYSLGKCVPGGAYVYDGYALLKGVGVAGSEVFANVVFSDRKVGLGEAYSHMLQGAGKGLLAIVQNHAGDIAKLGGASTGVKYLAKEFLIFAAPEAISSASDAAWKATEQGRQLKTGELIESMWDGFAKKSLAYGTNKMLGGLIGLTGQNNRIGQFFNATREGQPGNIPGIINTFEGNYTVGKFLSTFTTKYSGYFGLYKWENDKIKELVGLKANANAMKAAASQSLNDSNYFHGISKIK